MPSGTRRPWGQVSGGPSGVWLQSRPRISALRALSPGKTSCRVVLVWVNPAFAPAFALRRSPGRDGAASGRRPARTFNRHRSKRLHGRRSNPSETEPPRIASASCGFRLQSQSGAFP